MTLNRSNVRAENSTKKIILTGAATPSSGYHSLTKPELHSLKLENLVGRRRYPLVADQRAIRIQLADSLVAEPEVIAQDPLIVLT